MINSTISLSTHASIRKQLNSSSIWTNRTDSNQHNNLQMSQEMKSAQAFIKFLREKQNTIRTKITEKRNECINKLEENEKRLIALIPNEILEMSVGDFLERQEGDLDDIMMGSKSLYDKLKIQGKNEEGQNMEARFNSPPKKSFKKVIIKRAK